MCSSDLSIGSTDVVVQTTTTVPPTTTTKPVPTSTQPLVTTTTTTTTTTLPPKPTLPEPVTTINAIEVLTDGYEWGETGERVQLLQQVLGVAVDGIYRGPTRSMHLAALEERGLVVVGVPAPPTTTTTSTTTTTEAPRLTIETGKSVEASLAEGTRDQWHFEAVAGAEVTVRMTGFDTHLRLYDPDGELVVENDDHNEHFESALWFRVVEAGEYRIDAGGYDDVHHGAYTLTLEGAAVNIGACLDIALPESIKPCSMGIPAHAELMVGARDAWTFVGVRGSQVQIEMTGFDTHLRLFDPDGELMVENDDHNEHYESFLVAGLCSTGRYTIEAGGYADAHGGEYALTFLGGETPFEAITRSCND